MQKLTYELLLMKLVINEYVLTLRSPIGDGDPLKMDLMPSTSGDVNSHEADVVADESVIEEEIQPPIKNCVTARMYCGHCQLGSFVRFLEK
ncbi:hypothetical protein OUZ56_020568 [Daphnia magna]|uniref:Uncharacterized protein n=1 Tax=Daphnia magna TaxID=35525 RepID=A0ABQ9ZES8_9CRUS|nr:hypothetical protein OUZ56_020568 [Daphnia magna]